MGNHHHHHHNVVEEITQEQKMDSVIHQDKLYQFFENDMSHFEKRRFQFSATQRALAFGRFVVNEKIMKLIREESTHSMSFFAWCKMAVVNGVKQTANLAPFVCGSNLEQIKARIILDDANHAIKVYCYVSAFANRSIETEALAGVNAGLLSIYDHYKHIDPSLSFGEVQLLFKEDGHEGSWFNPKGMPEEVRPIFGPPIQFLHGVRAAIVSISDKALSGELQDAGELLQMRLEERGAEVVDYKLLPSKEAIISDYVKKIIKEKEPHLVMLRGAVGISPYDETSFATKAICERMIPGLGEMLRVYGSRYTLGAWNACCEAGVINRTLVISIPGARKVVDEVMQILPATLGDAIGHLQEKSLTTDHADEVEDYRMWV